MVVAEAEKTKAEAELKKVEIDAQRLDNHLAGFSERR